MSTFLIIGASSGIGKQLAQQLSISGHHVIGTYNKHSFDNISSIEYHHLDVLNTDADLSFIPSTLAGIAYCPGSISLKPFSRIKPEDFISDFTLQVTGAVRILQKALPAIKANGGGSVVLFSTVAVQTGLPFHTQVAASKGAIEGLTRSLAAEYAPSIRVNCIAPSLTDTPLAASLLANEEKREANAQRHPLKKIGSTEDIASMAEFLLSEKNAWITGQIIAVDGGMGSLKV